LSLSPWQKLLASLNDQTYITIMGFDFESFDCLLESFCPMFFQYTIFDAPGMITKIESVTGRERRVESDDCLGLVVLWK
jgi:hypothetical protein